MNITKLPDHVIAVIDESLKKKQKVTTEDVKLKTGDTLPGAGLLSSYRAWRHAGIDKVLRSLTEARREERAEDELGRRKCKANKRITDEDWNEDEKLTRDDPSPEQNSGRLDKEDKVR